MGAFTVGWHPYLLKCQRYALSERGCEGNEVCHKGIRLRCRPLKVFKHSLGQSVFKSVEVQKMDLFLRRCTERQKIQLCRCSAGKLARFHETLIMKCQRCQQPCFSHPTQQQNAMTWLMRDHSDVELCAYHCKGCRKTFCGSCCHPAWEGLKRQKGVSGPALAALLNKDPNACFSEKASCPNCGGEAEPVFKGGGLPPKPPATSLRYSQLRRTWDDFKAPGMLAVLLAAGSAVLIGLGQQWGVLLLLPAVGCLSFWAENCSAACPACGHMLRNVHHTSEVAKNAGAPQKCPQCGCRSISRAGWLVELPVDE